MKEILKTILLLSVIWFECRPARALNDKSSRSCPNPKVRKQTIIRSTESLENGAVLIGKDIVDGARSCYDLCCSYNNCNVALMHYKQVENELGKLETHKYCYLFACGTPSVCTFDDHKRYAVIELSATSYIPPTPRVTTTTTTTKKADEEEQEVCPPGAPSALCASDPCLTASCPAHIGARCRTSFCGTCHAVFYKDGDEVDCSIPSVVFAQSDKNQITSDKEHNEQALTVNEGDYDEAPIERLPDTKPHKVDDGEDPYFNSERRDWITDPSEKLLNEGTKATTTSTTVVDEKKKLNPTSTPYIPLLVALIICIMLLIGMIYRFKCMKRGKPKKFPVDDGDYLINGMYL